MTITSLQQDLNESLKAGKSERVETLRFLIAAVKNDSIAKYGNKAETSLTEQDIAVVVKKQVKTHRESVEAFEKAGRTDLAAREKAQLTILLEYSPEEVSDEELKKLLAPVVASGETNFGLLMKKAMEKVAGKADGGRIAVLLKQMLQK
ncbi:GatB/YqeY domain-containing protein [Candidatus Gottesmanbacteria bacterium]|nr:GatB/YqeY domain-containing protein [Candidatus Gottesmanbacteria bacterium]